MQIISYLNSSNLPIETLFYNVMESSDEIFKQIINQGKSRYQFYSRFLDLDELELIGVKKRVTVANGISDLQAHVDRLLELGKIIFIWLDQYYFPHRAFYLKDHLPHSFILTSLKKLEEKWYYYVDLDPDVTGKINNETFIKSLEYVSFPTSIIYFDFDDVEISIEIFKQKFIEWIKSYSDSYYFYEWLSKILDEGLSEGLLNSVDHSLAILSGSRYMFSKFISYINPNDTILIELKEIYKSLQILKNVFLKCLLSGKLHIETTRTRIMELKLMEQTLINNLKTRS